MSRRRRKGEKELPPPMFEKWEGVSVHFTSETNDRGLSHLGK